MGTERGGGVGAKSSPKSAGGEKEISWHHKGHDNSIIICTSVCTLNVSQSLLMSAY